MSRSTKPVVVTRDEGADGPLSRELVRLGLKVLQWPAVSVRTGAADALRAALERPQSFDWIVFTSRHAVAAVLALRPEPVPGVRIAAVGRATAQVLRQRGWPVDLVPEEASSAALVAAFATLLEARGARVLYPASSRALPTLAAGLGQLGAQVTQIEAYRTEGSALDVGACRELIARGAVGAVTFASPSAVGELAAALGHETFGRLLRQAPPVAIGRTTARALQAHGHEAVLAGSATLTGLAQATFRMLQQRT